MTREYGRRMLARRAGVVACGHLVKRHEQIFRRPGEQAWICRDCALSLARASIAAKESQAAPGGAP